MQNIALPTALNDQIISHALSLPQQEVCGLIGAINNQPFTVYPVKNIAEDLAHQFLMQPEAQIDAMRTMRDKQETLWGIYHSHPDSPAEPSATDLAEAAYPDIYYFIISLETETPQLNGFYFDGEKFEQIDIDSINTD